MADISFIRLAEVVNKKQDKRIVSVTVVPTITDCSGTIYFTDLQLQEGSALTGYAPHTEICLKESENDPVWFNGIVRSEETVILLNLGSTSAGLDIHLYPKQDIGLTRRLIDGNSGGCVCGPLGRRICGCGNGCRNRCKHIKQQHNIFRESAIAFGQSLFSYKNSTRERKVQAYERILEHHSTHLHGNRRLARLLPRRL